MPSESKRDGLSDKRFRFCSVRTNKRHHHHHHHHHTSNSSKALDRTGVVPPRPTLDAVIEGRNSGIKEWKFQRRAGMGQEMPEKKRITRARVN
jgi:hypothetical protein